VALGKPAGRLRGGLATDPTTWPSSDKPAPCTSCVKCSSLIWGLNGSCPGYLEYHMHDMTEKYLQQGGRLTCSVKVD
jgi:hypothetical protein